MTPPLTTWQALATEPFTAVDFLIRPYIPREGTILLFGKTSIGKSPLTWEMARCVGAGETFFEKPVHQGRVLYVELDTPKRLVQPRIVSIPPPPNVWWIFLEPCHIVTAMGVQQELRKAQMDVLPDLVVVNTLRQVHQGDEKDASLPTRIYSIFRAIFPQAATLFVHHDRKTARGPQEEQGDPNEAFSGHQAWHNHVQTGLHLVKLGGKVPGLLSLVHSKSQVSAQELPLTLQLAADGSSLCDYRAETAKPIIQAFYALPETMNKSERVVVVAKQLRLSERTVWTYLSHLPEP